MLELDHKKGWAPKNWCFWTVVLEKTLESPLDHKENKPVNPKGNQSQIIIMGTDAEAEAPILGPPDAKSWLIWKDPDPGKDWGQEQKGVTSVTVSIVSLSICHEVIRPDAMINNAGEGVEKREPSCSARRNVNWYSHYGQQYGNSLKNWE